MAEFSLIKGINAPLEKVFALFTDIDHCAGRIKAIKRAEKLTDGPVRVGTRIRETRVMFGKEATEEMEFTAVEPNQGYTLTCHSHGTLYRSRFRFQPDGAATIVTMDFDCQAQTILAKVLSPLGWLLMGTMKKCMQEDMDDMKAAAEAKETSVAPATQGQL